MQSSTIKGRLPSSSIRVKSETEESKEASPTPNKKDRILLEFEVNTFIKYYTSIHPIITLYDLSHYLCSLKKVTNFDNLELGPLIYNIEVQNFFSFPPSITSTARITSEQVTLKLFSYFQSNTGNHFTEDDFLNTLLPDLNLSHVNQLGVKITNFEKCVQFFGGIEWQKFVNGKEKETKEKILPLPTPSSVPSSSSSNKSRYVNMHVLQSNMTEFLNLFRIYHPKMLNHVTIHHLQTEIFLRFKTSTRIGMFRPYYAFLTLMFARYWKKSLDYSKHEINDIMLTSTLEKMISECQDYNDLEIVHLAFTLELGITPITPESWKQYPKEFPQLSFLVAKALKNFTGHHIPLVSAILLCKENGLNDSEILQDIFDKYYPGFKISKQFSFQKPVHYPHTPFNKRFTYTTTFPTKPRSSSPSHSLSHSHFDSDEEKEEKTNDRRRTPLKDRLENTENYYSDMSPERNRNHDRDITPTKHKETNEEKSVEKPKKPSKKDFDCSPLRLNNTKQEKDKDEEGRNALKSPPRYKYRSSSVERKEYEDEDDEYRTDEYSPLKPKLEKENRKRNASKSPPKQKDKKQRGSNEVTPSHKKKSEKSSAKEKPIKDQVVIDLVDDDQNPPSPSPPKKLREKNTENNNNKVTPLSKHKEKESTAPHTSPTHHNSTPQSESLRTHNTDIHNLRAEYSEHSHHPSKTENLIVTGGDEKSISDFDMNEEIDDDTSNETFLEVSKMIEKF